MRASVLVDLIPNKTKVNAKLYVETLLPELVQDCRSVLPSGFIFQQDGAPAHTAKLAQDWIAIPTVVNSLVKMHGLWTRPTSTLWTTMSVELCSWYGISCHKIRSTKPYWASWKDLGLCESGRWTLRTYAKMNYLWYFSISNNIQCLLTMEITSCCWLFHAELKNDSHNFRRTLKYFF